MHNNKKPASIHLIHALSAAIALASGSAFAFSIDTGNDDLTVRFDNTVKYNIGWRMEDRDQTLVNTPNFATSTLSHGKGDVVTNRVDILTEFDVIYKEDHGFRVSAAGWNDFAYDEKVKINPNAIGALYPNNKLSNKAERYYHRSGEILDAFVFTKFHVGAMPVNLRAGRHNIYWGEALFTTNDGVAYGQGPLDLRKATSTPGIEAKEMFLPQNQVSFSAQLTETVSLAANYSLEWDPHRLSDGGTFLAASDASFLGGQDMGLPHVGDLDKGPNKIPDGGDYGINLQIQSETLGGNVGIYYRKFDDRMPNIVADDTGTYLYNDYAENVKLYGLSFNRLIGSTSTGFELSRREGTTLAGNARGDTWHALANFMAYFGKNPVFDSASLTGELTYTKLDSVDSDTKAAFANSQDSKNCSLGLKGGCVSDDAWGMNLSFNPTWFQVFPGVDMSMPVNFAYGLKGNSPTPLGPSENGGSWSVGVKADVRAKYEATLAYNDYFGEQRKGAGNTLLGASGSGLLEDRGWLSLTLKTSF